MNWTLGACDRRSPISQYRISGERMGDDLHEDESARLRCDTTLRRKEQVSGCEGHLRFRKGSDYLRGILYFGRSPLYLGGGF